MELNYYDYYYYYYFKNKISDIKYLGLGLSKLIKLNYLNLGLELIFL